MSNYPEYVYRVEIDYLSKDYENSMLSTSSPYGSLEAAEKEYSSACGLFCVDDPKKPARVRLDVYTFAAPGAWATHETIKQNY